MDNKEIFGGILLLLMVVLVVAIENNVQADKSPNFIRLQSDFLFVDKNYDIENASFTLEKNGKVNVILECLNKNCSNYKETNISFAENDTHVSFEAYELKSYAAAYKFVPNLTLYGDLTEKWNGNDLEIKKNGKLKLDIKNVKSDIKLKLNKSTDDKITSEVIAGENLTFDSALVRLDKFGDVSSIIYCKDFDFDSFICDNWQESGIPFDDYGSYVEFTIYNFSAWGTWYNPSVINLTEVILAPALDFIEILKQNENLLSEKDFVYKNDTLQILNGTVSPSVDKLFYNWYRNGSLLIGKSGSTLSSDNFKKGDNISASAVPSNNSLVAYYSFDENSGSIFYDITGKANATFTNGTIHWNSSGKRYSAFEFEQEDIVTYINGTAQNNFSGAFTVEAWVRPRGFTETMVILERGTGATPSTIDVLISIFGGNRLQVIKSNGTNGKGNATDCLGANYDAACYDVSNWIAGEWHHVAGTWDGTDGDRNMKLYADGVMVNYTKGLMKNNKWTANSNWSIGLITRTESDSFNIQHFNGTIDEVAIWNVSLSAATIKNHYENSLAVYSTDKLRIDTNLGDFKNGTFFGLNLTYQSGNVTLLNTTLTTNVSGNLTSRIFDLGEKPNMTILSWGEAYKYGDEFEINDFTVALFHLNNNNTDDSSGLGNHLTSRNGTVECWSNSSNNGKFYGGCEFHDTKSGDILQGVDSASLDITNNVSVEAWILPKVDGRRTILSKCDNYWLETTNDGRIRWSVNNGSLKILSSVSYIYEINKWSHFAGTYDGKTMRAYINGIERGNLSANGALTTNNNNLTIGAVSKNCFGGGGQFNGTIDEVAIYNTTLTAAEIYEHFTRGAQLYFKTRTGDDTDYTHIKNKTAKLQLDFSKRNATHVLDLSDYNNDGEIKNASWTAGKYGKAFEFDGTRDQIKIKNSTSLNLTTAITMEAWVKADTWSGVFPIISKAEYNTDGYALSTRGSPYELDCILYGATNADILVPNSLLEANKFMHIACTWDGTNARIYLDGNLVNETASSGTLKSNNKSLLIGSFLNLGGTDYFFNGTIDSVAVYNRSLSAEEVKEHYLGLSDKFSEFSGPDYTRADHKNMMLGLDFSEMESTSTKDTSGNSNDGIIHGAGWTYKGKHGSALEFDGVNDYVNVSASQSLNATRITVEAWVKPTNYLDSGKYSWILSKINGSYANANYALYFYNASGYNQSLIFDFTIGGAYKIVSIDNGLIPYSWTHVAATHDSLNSRLYLNGRLVNTTINSGDLDDLDSNLYIGYSDYSGSQYFNGTIDSVAIYNISLNQSEIRKHYLNRFENSSGERLFDNKRYIQYKAFFETNYTNLLPVLTDVNFKQTNYHVQIKNTPPVNVSLKLPLNVTWILNNATLFNWTNSSDLDSENGTLKYEILIDNNTDFRSPEIARLGINNFSEIKYEDDEYTLLLEHFETFDSIEDNGGTLKNKSASSLVQGKFKNSIRFINPNSTINYSTKNILMPSKGSVEFWLNQSFGDRNKEYIFDSDIIKAYKTTENYILFNVTKNLTYANITSYSGFTHFTLTWESKRNLTIYIDGDFKNGTPLGEITSSIGNTFYIGTDNSGDFNLNGTIDELRISPLPRVPFKLLNQSSLNLTNIGRALKDGNYTWKVRVSDLDDRTDRNELTFSDWSKTFKISVDVNAPVIRSVNVTQAASLINLTSQNKSSFAEGGKNVTVNVSAIDISGSGIKSVWITVWDTIINGTKKLFEAAMTLIGDFYTITFKVNESFGHTINYTIQVNDTLNQSVELNKSFAVNFKPTIPSVLIDNNTWRNDSTPTIDWGTSFDRDYIAPNERDIVLHLLFNETSGSTVYDYSDYYQDNATITATWDRNAIIFDGTASTLANVTDSVGLNLTTNFTAIIWFKPNELASTYLNYKEDSAFETGFDIRHSGNQNKIALITRNPFTTTHGPNLSIDTWYHVAATYNSTTQVLYVDGDLVNSTVRSGSIGTNTNPIEIGKNAGTGDYFNGTVKEVVIFNRTLSAVEIKKIYQDSDLVKYNLEIDNASDFSSIDYLGINIVDSKNETPRLGDGAYHYRIRSNDTYEWSNYSGVYVINIDSTTPDINFTSNATANNTYLNSSRIFVNVSTREINRGNTTIYLYNSSAILNKLIFTDNTTSFNFSGLEYDNTSSGLVMYLKFNNNSGTRAYDYSGMGNDGLLGGIETGSGMPNWTTMGYHFSGLKFDGVDDNLNVTNSSSLNFGDNSTGLNFTVELWFKRSSVSQREHIIGTSKNILDVGWVIAIESSNITTFDIGDANTGHIPMKSVRTFSNRDWHHIAVVVNRKNDSKLYIDGTFENSSITSGVNALGDDNNISISSYYDVAGSNDYAFFNGTMDDIAIWNRTLNASEILSHYRLGEGTYYTNVTIHDKAANTNATEVRTFYIDRTIPKANLSSPLNNTGHPTDIIFNFTVSDTFALKNCSFYFNGTINQTNTTINSNTRQLNFTLTNLPVGKHNYSINCYDNASNLLETETRVFSVIKSTEFSGNTTDFKFKNVSSLTNLILQVPSWGKINFSEVINLVNGSDLDTYVNITNNRIGIDTDAFPELNKSAVLNFYSLLNLEQPVLRKNGGECPSTVCYVKSYGSSFGLVIANVTQFTYYQVGDITTDTGTSASSSIGGGGTPTTETQTTKLSLDKTDITLDLTPDETKTGELTVSNEGGNAQIITIEIEELYNFVIPRETKFTLNPGESKNIILDIKEIKDPGIYTGNVIIKSTYLQDGITRERTQKVPIVLEVKSKEVLFDSDLTLDKKFKKVQPGKSLEAQITVFSLGDVKNVDIGLVYIIKDLNGRVILEEKETITIENQASFTKEFKIPENSEEGTYLLGLEVRYKDSFSADSQLFEVTKETKLNKLTGRIVDKISPKLNIILSKVRLLIDNLISNLSRIFEKIKNIVF